MKKLQTVQKTALSSISVPYVMRKKKIFFPSSVTATVHGKLLKKQQTTRMVSGSAFVLIMQNMLNISQSPRAVITLLKMWMLIKHRHVSQRVSRFISVMHTITAPLK